MKIKICLIAVLTLLCTRCFAQTSAQKTKNVVLILIDGLRWQELFHGADYSLLTNPKFNSMDSIKRMRMFWSDNVKERREKLMPFTWNYIVKHGQIYGNRDLGNKVNVKNPYWISYPGRAEVLSGFVDKKISSNGYGTNTNPNILEFINKQEGYEDLVVAFTCWDASGRCLNKKNSDMLISVPWEDIPGEHLTEAEVLANEIQHYAPKTFGIIERLDFEVYALAKSYIRAHNPKVVYIDFGDTDEYAHAGEYARYLLDAHNLDDMIRNLWEMMQQDPFYKGNTTFFIVPDHGRGVGDQWTSHGANIPHSDETWFMVMGPDTKPSGEMRIKEQLYQDQYAKTLTALLGLQYNVSDQRVGKPISSVLQ